MKIYTKTGDDGTTSLFDGTRVGKDNERVHVYGEVDELNSVVGVAASFVQNAVFQTELQNIQKDLFALGAKLANPLDKKQKDKADFGEDKILVLESSIDKMEAQLETMTSFILPGGSKASAFLHHARTLCRRAERSLVAFNHHTPIDVLYVRFLNRLSDYLFVAARFANHLENVPDVKW